MPFTQKEIRLLGELARLMPALAIQNIEVGSELLAFGVSQQIRVMKWPMGEAAREECGTK